MSHGAQRFPLRSGALGLLCASAGAAAVAAGWLWVGILLLAIACGATLKVAVSVSGSFASLTVIFLFFHAVYGFSGPIAALTGAPLPDVFSTPFKVDLYLLEFGLATFALCAGLLIAAATRVVPPGQESARIRSVGSPRAGIILVALGSLFELINCIRAGGWTIIIQGKAVYQSEVDALVLTLPSSQLVALGLALAALAWSQARLAGQRGFRWRDAILLLLAIAPSLAITLALGFRSPMLEWLLVVLVGATYHTPLRRINLRIAALIVILYVTSGVVYASRAVIGLGLATGDWSAVGESVLTTERLILAVNPAATEFGAAFGNFSEYNRLANEPLRYGSSYLQSLLLPVPGFLYPGKKPQQIGYEFRDRYFSSMAADGAIAGTAYSSLLEAYVNFGVAGPLLVYFILAWLLALAERARQTRPEAGWHIGYLLLVSSAVAFHRSDFSFLVGTFVLNAMVILGLLGGITLLGWLRPALYPSRAPASPAPDVVR